MTPNIVDQAKSNRFAFESSALIKAAGFWEYDARWWFGHPGSETEPELNLMDVQALGIGLGALIQRMGVGPDIVPGHDFRSYSMAIRKGLISGLMPAGGRVRDIGFSSCPMVSFAQFALHVPSVAMVTASHNDNAQRGTWGWSVPRRTNRKSS